jgi:nucleotide-binding universal stress UspA family protein
MKTIAVLTDFSDRSEQAARYALHLAQKIKANVLLFNAFLVPSDTPLAGEVVWPLIDYNEVKKNSQNSLITLCSKLELELKDKRFAGTFLPSVSYQCEEGAIANAITELEEDKNIALLVLATHGADDMSAFMMGNNCRQVIDAAKLPLLIVPEGAAIKSIEKFAFATDFTSDDLEYINSLVSLAKPFTAEIVVTNVNQDSEHENASNLFTDKIASKVNYGRIYYHNITDHSAKRGLQWLVENFRFDMLVMVHRKSSFFEFFFKSSITKKIADHTSIPLLVYPYPASRIPLF